jgi:hypothetical protein
LTFPGSSVFLSARISRLDGWRDRNLEEGENVGSVIKKRRKKMRKHKKRKLLRRARHKRKR